MVKTPLRNLVTRGWLPNVPPSVGKMTVDNAERALLIALQESFFWYRSPKKFIPSMTDAETGLIFCSRQ